MIVNEAISDLSVWVVGGRGDPGEGGGWGFDASRPFQVGGSQAVLTLVLVGHLWKVASLYWPS